MYQNYQIDIICTNFNFLFFVYEQNAPMLIVVLQIKHYKP